MGIAVVVKPEVEGRDLIARAEALSEVLGVPAPRGMVALSALDDATVLVPVYTFKAPKGVCPEAYQLKRYLKAAQGKGLLTVDEALLVPQSGEIRVCRKCLMAAHGLEKCPKAEEPGWHFKPVLSCQTRLGGMGYEALAMLFEGTAEDVSLTRYSLFDHSRQRSSGRRTPAIRAYYNRETRSHAFLASAVTVSR